MSASKYTLQSVVTRAPAMPQFNLTINGVRYIGRPGSTGVFIIMRAPRWARSTPNLPTAGHMTVSSMRIPGIARIGLEFQGEDIEFALRDIMAATGPDVVGRMGAIQNALKPVIVWLEQNFGV